MKSWRSKLLTLRDPSVHPWWLDRLPRPLGITLRALGCLSLPLFPLMCLLTLDYMNFGKLDKLLVFVQENPLSVVFECVVMLGLFLGLLLLFRFAAAAAGVQGFFSLLLGYINYTKFSLNGDHFHPRDITMASNMGGLTGFISGGVPRWFLYAAVVIVLWTVVLGLLRIQLPLRWYVRLPVLLAAAVAVGSMFSTMERSNRVLNKFDMEFMDAALQSSNYKANGFVGAFTINLLMMRTQAPAGYSQEKIQGYLEGYEDRPAVSDPTEYDVIVVLSESFFDVRTLPGVEFSQNPLPNYDAVLERPETYSGTMYSTASGGGTVRPEFDVLTGLTTDYLYDVPSPYELVSKPVESFVSLYKEAGYHTLALHPYNKTFYRRDQAYPYLGFDQLYGQDDLAPLVFLTYRHGVVDDDSTLRCIQYFMDQAEEPTFLLAITMENHQPYYAESTDENAVRVSSQLLDDDTRTAVEVYSNGLRDADIALGALVDYVDSRERPTILLFFGDHIPSLGINKAAYYETGLTTEDVPPAQRAAYLYSSPFLIYSNTGAESGLMTQHRNNQVSSYYLMEMVTEMTGFRQTPYMQLLADWYKKIPYYNIRLELEETPERQALAEMHQYITYDRLMGQGYSRTP